MTMKIYQIARWRSVFETPKSRHYQALTWISCPINFNSTGYQHLLEAFEDNDNEFMAAAVYGAWQALCQLAAAHPDKRLRGVLCGERGEPYTIKRIARLTGLPATVFEELFVWAVGEGWLVEYDPESDRVPDESPAGTDRDPDESPAGSLPNVTLPDLTSPEHNPTPSEPDPRTKPDPDLTDDRRRVAPTRPRGDGEGSDLFWQKLVTFPALLKRAVKDRNAAFFAKAWGEAAAAGWVRLDDRETRRRFLAACWYVVHPPEGFPVDNAARVLRHKLCEHGRGSPDAWTTGCNASGDDDRFAKQMEQQLDGTASLPRTSSLHPQPRSPTEEIRKLQTAAR